MDTLGKLIDKKIITVDTILHAEVTKTGLGLQPIQVKSDLWVVGVHNGRQIVCRDDRGNRHVIVFEDIETIDGSDIPRLLSAFGITDETEKSID